LYSLQDRKAAPFAGIQSTQPISSVFSPDGRWVAYTTTGTGVNEVYVQPFPAKGATKYQISKTRSASSASPVWSSDGKELLYSDGAAQYAAVSISTQPSFTFGSPVPVTKRFAANAGSLVRNYDITPDGRFIGTPFTGALDPESATLTNPQIQVVLHWFEELKQRVPLH
jgi:Tol biopolymer transport system component